MASFTDRFERADEAIEDSDWIALDAADDASNVVRVSASRAVSNSTSQRTIAWHTGTKPTGVPQECNAVVSSSAQGSNHYIDVGVMGKSGASGFSSLAKGVWVRIHYLANGARRLSLYRHLPQDAAEAAVVELDIVAAGSVEVAGYEGQLIDVGATSVPQLVRIVVTATTVGGLRARVFLNTQDDDVPVIDAVIDRDFIGTGDSNQTYGTWWIGFGPSADSALAVAGVVGQDYVDDEGKSAIAVREDQPTLLQVVTKVRARYERSARGTLTDAAIHEAVIRGLRRIRDVAGSNMQWLRTTATLTLTVDSGGECTLPDDVYLPTDVVSVSSGARVRMRLLSRTTSGACLISLGGISGSYRVTYMQRWAEPSGDGERVPIPKEYDHTLVAAACAALAEDEGRADMAQIYLADFSFGMQGLLAWQALDFNAMGQTVAAARLSMPYHRR